VISGIRIERLEPDAPDRVRQRLAELHRAEISAGFLSTLGPKFLGLLYRTLAGSPVSFVLTAMEGEEVRGFIVGSENTRRVYRDFFKRAGLRAVFLLARRLLSLRTLFRVMETLLYPGKADRDLPSSEILNFCVDQSVQRRGVGRLLFDALVEEFARRGIPQIKIVTGGTQDKAQRFYARVGARLIGKVEVHRGTPSVVYVFDIPAPVKTSVDL
jgi:ribosomal protein S18 acetylase RimI-like enzyme